MASREFKCDTQELLSINMDRLRQYMKTWQTLATGQGHEALEDRPARRKRGSTTILRPGARRSVLLVRSDPLVLSRLIGINDGQPVEKRLGFTWAGTFGEALARMADERFHAVVVAQGAQHVREVGLDLTGTDFLLLLQGITLHGDPDFLLKKKGFVGHLVPGATDEARVALYRRLREEYRNQTFFYIHDRRDAGAAGVAGRILGVKVVDVSAGPEPLFGLIRDAVL